jgi:hypothetical protein
MPAIMATGRRLHEADCRSAYTSDRRASALRPKALLLRPGVRSDGYNRTRLAPGPLVQITPVSVEMAGHDGCSFRSTIRPLPVG